MMWKHKRINLNSRASEIEDMWIRVLGGFMIFQERIPRLDLPSVDPEPDGCRTSHKTMEDHGNVPFNDLSVRIECVAVLGIRSTRAGDQPVKLFPHDGCT